MKSIHKPEFLLFRALLRDVRTGADLSQIALAERLGVPQAYVSAFELGKVRQDFVQIRDWCTACGTTLADLANQFDARWAIEGPALTRLVGKPAKKVAKSATTREPASAKPAAKAAGKPVKKRSRAK
jgi:transcriptional regulator with XRE-family HTH domain